MVRVNLNRNSRNSNRTNFYREKSSNIGIWYTRKYATVEREFNFLSYHFVLITTPNIVVFLLYNEHCCCYALVMPIASITPDNAQCPQQEMCLCSQLDCLTSGVSFSSRPCTTDLHGACGNYYFLTFMSYNKRRLYLKLFSHDQHLKYIW